MRFSLTRGLTALLRGLVIFYRWVISPLHGPCCRYMPTCSAYALDALTVHGPVRGSLLAARRVCRCHPWGGQGYDPVPPVTSPKSGCPER